MGDACISAAVALAEVGREGREVGAVDGGAVEEIALVPVGDALTEIGREDAEVGAIHHAVEIGVAKKRVFQFNFAAEKAGDIAVAVGIRECAQPA